MKKKIRLIIFDFNGVTVKGDHKQTARHFGRLQNKMKRGDILIAETTSPDVMALCRKARAIVADQGGLLSHAAVISREFGTPCIIGTENATRIFKSGDMVEVDANHGII